MIQGTSSTPIPFQSLKPTASNTSVTSPMASTEPTVASADEQHCASHVSADFSAADEGCQFPSPLSPSSDLNAIPGSIKDQMGGLNFERPQFGDVQNDVGEQLLDALDAESAAPGTAREGLSAEATALLDKLPPDRQSEAAVYLSHLASERGEALGSEKMNALLGQLTDMTERSYDPRLGTNADVVVSALKDIAAPTDIEQGANTDTCSATAAQIALATKDPERYLNMVDTLAQNKSFEVFEPDWSFTGEAQREGNTIRTSDSYRTPTAKLVQNAIMERAFPNEDYTSVMESMAGKEGGGTFGADEIDAARTFQEVMGDDRPAVVHHVENTAEDGSNEYPESDTVKNMPAQQVIENLKAYQPSPENPVLMAYDDPEVGGGHAALIIGAEGDTITYVDPLDGRVKSVSAEALAPQIWSVSLPGT